MVILVDLYIEGIRIDGTLLEFAEGVCMGESGEYFGWGVTSKFWRGGFHEGEGVSYSVQQWFVDDCLKGAGTGNEVVGGYY